MSLIAVTVVLLTAISLFALARLYRRAKEVRVVHCPATHASAAIRLDFPGLAFGFLRHPAVHVEQCSLWPERALCAQACLSEVKASPQQCAFQRMLAGWYGGKQCVFCGRAVPAVRSGEPKPALLAPDGRLLAWSDVVPLAVYEVLATHQPVCSSCDIAETVRRRYPDRVVERPPRPHASRT